MNRSHKLTYFNIPGRAELSRLTFVAGGIPFVDDRTAVSEDDFGASDLKPQMPLRQLPVLNIDGELYPQSLAIARYAAKLGGLYPEDPSDAIKLDAVLDTIADLRNAVGDIRWGRNDDTTKAIKTKHYLETLLPTSLQYIEHVVAGPFLYGQKLSLADLAIYDIEKNSIRAAFPELDAVAAYPKLARLIESVKANDRIAAYLASVDK